MALHHKIPLITVNFDVPPINAYPKLFSDLFPLHAHQHQLNRLCLVASGMTGFATWPGIRRQPTLQALPSQTIPNARLLTLLPAARRSTVPTARRGSSQPDIRNFFL